MKKMCHMITINESVLECAQNALSGHSQSRWDRMRDVHFIKRRWGGIINRAEENQSMREKILRDSCIVGFSYNSTLPKEVAQVVSSYINRPIRYDSLYTISKFVKFLKRQEKLRTGRGGDGMRTTEKYKIKTQLPRLLFSQCEFESEIRYKAHASMFRRLRLHGNTEEQLSRFFLVLMNIM